VVRKKTPERRAQTHSTKAQHHTTAGPERNIQNAPGNAGKKKKKKINNRSTEKNTRGRNR